MLILEIQQTTFQQTTNFPACKGLNGFLVIKMVLQFLCSPYIYIYGEHVVASLSFLTSFGHTFLLVSHSAFNILPISYIFGMQVPCIDLYLLMRFEVNGVKVKVSEANNRFSQGHTFFPFNPYIDKASLVSIHQFY